LRKHEKRGKDDFSGGGKPAFRLFTSIRTMIDVSASQKPKP